jgi:hypothetical protein
MHCPKSITVKSAFMVNLQTTASPVNRKSKFRKENRSQQSGMSDLQCSEMLLEFDIIGLGASVGVQ